MRLVVLGASGGCGQWLVRHAAARGHGVTAVAREGSPVPEGDGIAVRRGDVTDGAFLADVVAGHDAVLSALGIRRAAKAPRARMLSPPDFMTRVAAQLVPAMQRHGVRRLVAISAGGVGDSAAQLTPVVRAILGLGTLGAQYRDLAGMEAALGRSDLDDWLVVRPVTLVNGPPRGRAHPVTRYGVFSHARRSEVAEWMVRIVEAPGTFRERSVLLAS